MLSSLLAIERSLRKVEIVIIVAEPYLRQTFSTTSQASVENTVSEALGWPYGDPLTSHENVLYTLSAPGILVLEGGLPSA